MSDYERKRVLVTVKAYPEYSTKYKESVCTAGITDDGEWIRLYPVPFAIFRSKRTFKKYSWIEVDCKPNVKEKLHRKESYKIRPDSIRIVDDSLTKGNRGWDIRDSIVLPMKSSSIKELQEKFAEDKTSLGLIKPTSINALTIDKEISKEDLEVSGYIRNVQMTLEGTAHSRLEKIPHIFKYQFECNESDCSGHHITCEDWEMFQAWRAYRQKYPTPEILIEKFHDRFFNWMQSRNLYFYMGTHSLYPTWIIIGLYYPPIPAPKQLTIDDSSRTTPLQ